MLKITNHSYSAIIVVNQSIKVLKGFADRCALDRYFSLEHMREA